MFNYFHQQFFCGNVKIHGGFGYITQENTILSTHEAFDLELFVEEISTFHELFHC